MDALGLEPGLLGKSAQDEERARARERAAARVQEEIGPVAAVEMRPAQGEVAARGLGRRASQGHEAFLPALPEHADDAALDVDRALLEPDRLRDPQPCSVEELDERSIPQRARRRPSGGIDQTLGLGGGEHAGEMAASTG